MNVLDVYASRSHYAANVAPVWDALPPERRGRLLCEPEAGPMPVLVAASGDLAAMRRMGRSRTALMEHGSGQSYGGRTGSGRNTSYAGGMGRLAGLFLHPGEHPAGRDRAAYPKARVEVVGSPYLETLPAREPAPGPVVAVAWHANDAVCPETRSAFGHFRAGILALAERYQVIGSGHPRVIEGLAHWYEREGIEGVRDFAEVCRRADVLVADNTSALFLFAATGRPVVFCKAPWYDPRVHHGLLFWDAVPGVECDSPAELVDAVAEALVDDASLQAKRAAAIEQVYPIRGDAAQRAAGVLCDWLD